MNGYKLSMHAVFLALIISVTGAALIFSRAKPEPPTIQRQTWCPTPAQREASDASTWIRHTLIEGNTEHRIIHHPSSIDCPVCIEEGSQP